MRALGKEGLSGVRGSGVCPCPVLLGLERFHDALAELEALWVRALDKEGSPGFCGSGVCPCPLCPKGAQDVLLGRERIYNALAELKALRARVLNDMTVRVFQGLQRLSGTPVPLVN